MSLAYLFAHAGDRGSFYYVHTYELLLNALLLDYHDMSLIQVVGARMFGAFAPGLFVSVSEIPIERPTTIRTERRGPVMVLSIRLSHHR